MTTKTILIAIIILATNHIKSQDFSENFLGNDFLNYKNVYLKINDAVNEGFSTCFYDELKEATSISSYKILYVDSTYASQSVKDSLINRIFLVKDILDKRSGKPIIGAYYNEKAIFVLEDTLNKQQIFFIYNTKVKRNFPFLVSEIKIDTDKVCSEIERTQDDFNGNIKLNSSIFSNITIYKEISKKGTFYYLRLRTKGSTVIVDGIGAIILFTDGTKITNPVKIDVDAESDGFNYSAFFTLTQKDLEILSKKQIKKFRLYIFDHDITHFDAEKFNSLVTCIMGKN